jgi:hypothetical protein
VRPKLLGVDVGAPFTDAVVVVAGERRARAPVGGDVERGASRSSEG